MQTKGEIWLKRFFHHLRIKALNIDRVFYENYKNNNGKVKIKK
jgi:hypothetical protein